MSSNIACSFKHLLLLHIPFQQECAEVREGDDVFTGADIADRELDAMSDVRVAVAFDELRQGFRAVRVRLDLERDELVRAADEEVFLQGGVLLRLNCKSKCSMKK